MGIYEYAMLDTDERATLLWSAGVFLETFATEQTTSKLYSLDNFFVEVVVDNKENKIIEVTPFARGARLAKYLNRVSLEQFL